MVDGFEKAMACSRARPEPGPLHWLWLGQGFEKAETPSGLAKAGAPRPSRAGTSLLHHFQDGPGTVIEPVSHAVIHA